jgi:Tol biopolymer transport system component
MNARLTLAAATVAFMAAGLLRPDVLLIAQQPAALPPVPQNLASLETHLADIRMLTDKGENAEAYFSPDGSHLIFQSSPDPVACDQMYVMKIDGSDVRRVSNGQGRTTCGFFSRDAKQIVYASTHGTSPACPDRPSMARGYVWPIFDGYDIYTANADGSGTRALTSSPGYDAEATVGPHGRIVFTSVRDGDMEIYSMAGDGSDVKRLTNLPGPDGGAFYSPDGTQIVFRGRHPQAGTPEFVEYFTLLKEGLWKPTSTELYIMNADGSNLRQITDNGAANFAPFWTPDGKRLIFSSNLHNLKGRNFDLFLINADGSGVEQVTHHPDFDGFPMFSPDGTHLVFASNRNQKTRGDTNIFMARWKP